MISKDEDDSSFDYHSAPKRPKTLKADLHKTTIKGEPYGIVIGLLNDKPYELFCVPGWKDGNLKGEITKQKKRKFDFITENVIIENLNSLGSKEQQTVNILLSGIFRHGTDPKHLIKWIDKIELDIVAYENAIKRIIRKYIKEESTIDVCPECNEHSLIMEGGCSTCNSCGYTACG